MNNIVSFCIFLIATQIAISSLISAEAHHNDRHATLKQNNNTSESVQGSNYEERNCTCNGQTCFCCINFNLSFIDLGGPGCVKFVYLNSNDSIDLNMSYGDRLLHSSQIQRTDEKPTCMNLFSDLAQMCSRFTHVSIVRNGIKGCLTIEPMFLGDSQAVYHVGCFDMDQENGIALPNSFPSYKNGTEEAEVEEEEEEEETEEEDEKEFATAIKQSAEEGLAWFNTLITSVFGAELSNNIASTNSTTNGTNNPEN